MPKSKLANSSADVLEVANSLVAQAKEAMTIVFTSLSTIGFKGRGIVMVSPDDTPDAVVNEILDAIKL